MLSVYAVVFFHFLAFLTLCVLWTWTVDWLNNQNFPNLEQDKEEDTDDTKYEIP